MKKVVSRTTALAVILAYSLTALGAVPVEGATYTVTNTDNVGPGSLNSAIQDANANPGLDTIDFAITGCSGVCTIQLTTPLPEIDDPVIIDGLTQTGASAGDLWAGTGHVLRVEIDGSSIGSAADGLSISAGGSTVRGLVIHSFGGYAIRLSSSGSNTIETNYIGTDPSGEVDQGNALSGIMLDNVPSNTIGGSSAGSGNLISGNGQAGIYIQSTGAASNQIKGNFIGTDKDGEQPIGNGSNGITLDAPWTVVGGAGVHDGNLISANTSAGIWMAGAYAYQNRIWGNYIGVTRHGTVQPADLGNGMDGVYIANCEHNTIGGGSAGQGNVISGNTGNGVRVSGGSAISNDIIGNLIGTDKDGANAIPNGSNGVQVLGQAWSTQIGGDQSGEGNLISGNTQNGVDITDSATYYTHLEGNLIGTDLAGVSAVPNGQYGVRIASGAYFSVVGGASAGAHNVISGNSQGGVLITGTSTIYNDLRGNYIGTSVTGQDPLPNIGPGVLIESEAGENTVGGSSPGQGNLIAFNTSDGVRVSGGLTSANEITRNRIFQNGGAGIALLSGANGAIAAPTITSTSLATMSISGTACGSCTVEVFANPETDGEGKLFLGSATASAGGSFTLTVGGIPEPYLTATATDSTDGTSEFSSVFTSSFGSIYLPLIMR